MEQRTNTGEPVDRAVDWNHHASFLHMLSERQCRIAQLIAQGFSNPSVAQVMECSVKAVERHVEIIYTKLGFDAYPKSHANRVLLSRLMWEVEREKDMLSIPAFPCSCCFCLFRRALGKSTSSNKVPAP